MTSQRSGWSGPTAASRPWRSGSHTRVWPPRRAAPRPVRDTVSCRQCIRPRPCPSPYQAGSEVVRTVGAAGQPPWISSPQRRCRARVATRRACRSVTSVGGRITTRSNPSTSTPTMSSQSGPGSGTAPSLSFDLFVGVGVWSMAFSCCHDVVSADLGWTRHARHDGSPGAGWVGLAGVPVRAVRVSVQRPGGVGVRGGAEMLAGRVRG